MNILINCWIIFHCWIVLTIVETFCTIVETLHDCVETSKYCWKQLTIVQRRLQNDVLDKFLKTLLLHVSDIHKLLTSIYHPQMPTGPWVFILLSIFSSLTFINSSDIDKWLTWVYHPGLPTGPWVSISFSFLSHQTLIYFSDIHKLLWYIIHCVFISLSFFSPLTSIKLSDIHKLLTWVYHPGIPTGSWAHARLSLVAIAWQCQGTLLTEKLSTVAGCRSCLNRPQISH